MNNVQGDIIHSDTVFFTPSHARIRIYGGPGGRATRRCLCDDDDATIDDDDATIDDGDRRWRCDNRR